MVGYERSDFSSRTSDFSSICEDTRLLFAEAAIVVHVLQGHDNRMSWKEGAKVEVKNGFEFSAAKVIDVLFITQQC